MLDNRLCYNMSKLTFVPPESVRKVETHDDLLSSMRRKIPRGPIPVVPKGDTCCEGVCEELNNRIERLSKRLDFTENELRYTPPGSQKRKIRNAIRNQTAQITSLKEHRIGMKEKGICTCIMYKRELG